MKTSKRILFTLMICLLVVYCCACSNNSSNETEATKAPVPETSSETASEISSETAMDNFIQKLNSGNYVIDAGEYLKTTVYSPELVCFNFYDESYDDYAFVTYQDDTFRVVMNEDSVSGIEYSSSRKAVDMAQVLLPNGWLTVSEGNMYNLFYNNVDAPLEFVSYEDAVKLTLLRLNGYSDMALSLTHEVYMVFDAEDPSSVHFTAVVDDNPVTRVDYDDLDLTLEFGAAESDPRMDAWLSNPVYPETRTSWSEGDLFYLNSVFLPGYGEDAIPFPDFASYALIFDEEVFSNEEKILLTDAHGTESDLESYKEALLENGFSEVKAASEDGSEITVYRRPLREDYRCYVSAYPYFDNGFVLEAERYYDLPVYDSLADINSVIEENGFARLAENEHLKGWTGKDTAVERSESWLYFFDYALNLYVNIQYDDEDELEAYLKDYEAQLAEKGYKAVYSSDEETPDHYESTNSFSTFRYAYENDGTVTLLFRNEKNISPEEASGMISEAGFPEIDLYGDIACRDLTDYHRMTRDFKGQLYLAVSQPFESRHAAEAFLDEYTASLEDAGYYYANPEMIGSLKQFAYYNEEEDKYVAFDLIAEDDGVDVYFDFVSNYESSLASLLLRH